MTETTETSVGDAPLVHLFGRPACTKLISVFVAERGRDLSVSDLARQAGIVRSTVYDHLNLLQTLGVIEHTRDMGGGHSPRYQLSEESGIADLCYQLEGITLRRLLELDGAIEE